MGHFYFGARYYDSELSVWLSVDPMSDKYPDLSPYMYVGGNPVMITDPDGNDWFINEETGDLYYNSSIGKDNMDQLNGTDGYGYTWFGENDMFGLTEDEMRNAANERHGIVNQTADYAGTYTFIKENNDEISYDQAHFSGENAEKFMNAVGYFKKPKVAQMIETATTQYSFDRFDGIDISTTFDESVYKVLKWTYARNDSKVSSEYRGTWKRGEKENWGPHIKVKYSYPIKEFFYNKQ